MGRRERESTAVTKRFSETLSKLILHAREETGLTQNELAAEIGVGAGALSLWMSDSATANIDGIHRVATYFNVSTDWLLGLSNIQSTDANIQNVCDYTGLSEQSVMQIKDMGNPSNKESLQVFDKMLATEEFQSVISYIVYTVKAFEEIKSPKIFENLNAEERNIVAMAKKIIEENDPDSVYFVSANETAKARVQLLQEIFGEMVENLFLKDKEFSVFPLETIPKTDDSSTK